MMDPRIGLLIDLEDSEVEIHPRRRQIPEPDRRHGAQRGARTHDPEITERTGQFNSTFANDVHQEVTPKRSGPEDQWRPTTRMETQMDQNQINHAMLTSLQTLTQHLLNMEDNRQPTPDFTFAGADEEDPEVFIARLETFFLTKRVKEENKLTVARKVLRGEARRWAESVTQYDIPWKLFVAQLVGKYNSPATISRITRKLYGETQSSREDPVAFVTTKFQLFNRIIPDTPERQQVLVIQELLSPWYRSNVRQANCQSIHALMETVAQIGTDLQEQTTTPHPGGLRFYRGENTPRATPPSTAATNNTAPGTSGGVPPNPCRHCGGPHYNNRCPTRNSGNGDATVQLGRGRQGTTPAPQREPVPTPRGSTPSEQ